MKKIIIIILLIASLTSCSKQMDNELLLESYKKQDYAKCLKILQSGADGRVNYLKPDSPLLFDICRKYLNNTEKSSELESLLDFYLKNRKDAFEDSISGIYPKQTVGSYIARFATVDLLRRIVQEKININSPEEKSNNTAIYELSMIDEGYPIQSEFFNDLKINPAEKKERMELLLNAGAIVTLVNEESKASMFHFFSWYPFEENYTELLDKMIEKGANLFQKDWNGYSCINYTINDFALDRNTEKYLEYVISRGLHATKEDLVYFISRWYNYIRSDEVTETELQRLEKIKKILENDTKLTLTIKSVGGWEIR